jgi:DNA-binding HxlR family transcriptional regulator
MMSVATPTTRSSTIPKRRVYGEACAASHALDLVGERWALLIVRELLLGPKRFTDLRAGLPGVSPNVLTERLTGLESAGIVNRRRLPAPAASWVYELTEWGLDLEPVIVALGRWGVRSPAKPRNLPLGIDSLVLSFRTMFDPGMASGLSASFDLRLGEDRFRAKVARGWFDISRGAMDRPDAIVETDAATLGDLVYGDRTLDDATQTGDILVTGDVARFERFLRLFPLPDPVEPSRT